MHAWQATRILPVAHATGAVHAIHPRSVRYGTRMLHLQKTLPADGRAVLQVRAGGGEALQELPHAAKKFVVAGGDNVVVTALEVQRLDGMLEPLRQVLGGQQSEVGGRCQTARG